MPKRHLCTRLTLLIAACALTASCREQSAILKGRRFSVPQDMLQAHSLRDLTNNFNKYSDGLQCELKPSAESEYALLTRYPRTGVGIFEVYCYEKIGQDHWILRGIQFIYGSQSMKVDATNRNGVLEIGHGGHPLSSFLSSRATNP